MSSSKPTLSIWKQPWQNQNWTEHVNWLPEAPQFFGQQIDAWWIKTLDQTAAEHTICFSAIPLIREAYFNLFLFLLSFHGQCYHPTIFCHLSANIPVVVSFLLLGAVLSELNILMLLFILRRDFFFNKTPRAFFLLRHRLFIASPLLFSAFYPFFLSQSNQPLLYWYLTLWGKCNTKCMSNSSLNCNHIFINFTS